MMFNSYIFNILKNIFFFRTNFPRMLMSLPDYPIIEDGARVATHNELHDYLKNYTKAFNLLPYIKVQIHNLIH